MHLLCYSRPSRIQYIPIHGNGCPTLARHPRMNRRTRNFAARRICTTRQLVQRHPDETPACARMFTVPAVPGLYHIPPGLISLRDSTHFKIRQLEVSTRILETAINLGATATDLRQREVGYRARGSSPVPGPNFCSGNAKLPNLLIDHQSLIGIPL